MKVRLVLERSLLILSIFVLAGTNRCREDYFFATQTKISLTGTVTVTVTGTVSGTVSATSTPNGTATVEPTETDIPEDPTPTDTPTVAPTGTAAATAKALEANYNARLLSGEGKSSGLLAELATLDKPENSLATKKPKTNQQSPTGNVAADQSGGNWLG